MKKKFIIQNKFRIFSIGILTSLIFLLPAIFYKNFSTDWNNNIWMFDYYKEYILKNHSLPYTLNTSNCSIGLTNPLYYGVWFYRIMGFLTILFGEGNITMRICIFACSLIQFFAWYLAFSTPSRAGNSLSFYAALIALFSVISTYSFTDLYNRGAVTEYFATTILSSVIGLWIYSVFLKDLRKKIAVWIIIAFFVTIIAGTHPITTMLGGLFFFFLFLFTIRKSLSAFNKHEITILLITGTFLILLCVIITLPWIYMLKNYAPLISAGDTCIYFPEFDQWWIRLWPTPLDTLSLQINTPATTAYLDAQVNFPLLLTFIVMTVFIIKNKLISGIRKRRLIPLWLLFILLYVISVSEPLIRLLNPFLRFIQFIYRTVTYLDLSLLIGISYCFYVLLATDREILKNQMQKLIIFTATAAFMCVSVKYTHISANATGANAFDKKNIIELTSSFYWMSDYRNCDGYQEIEQASREPLVFPIDCNDNFGSALPIHLSVTENASYAFSVLPHPWNRLFVNNQIVDLSNCGCIFNICDSVSNYIVINFTPGEYEITYCFLPDNFYVLLNHISKIVFCIFFILTAAAFVFLIKLNSDLSSAFPCIRAASSD